MFDDFIATNDEQISDIKKNSELTERVCVKC